MSPRLLTPELAKQIRHFYYWTNLGSEFFVWLLWPVGIYWGLSFLVGLVSSDEVADQYVTANVYFVVLALLVGWRLWRRRQNAAHATEAYQLGRAVPIYLVSVANNWGFKLNGVPRSIITLRKEDELLTIKTFDSTVVDAYGLPSQTAYVLDKYPSIVLPASILVNDSQPPHLRTRNVSI